MSNFTEWIFLIRDGKSFHVIKPSNLLASVCLWTEMELLGNYMSQYICYLHPLLFVTRDITWHPYVISKLRQLIWRGSRWKCEHFFPLISWNKVALKTNVTFAELMASPKFSNYGVEHCTEYELFIPKYHCRDLAIIKKKLSVTS